MCLHKYVCSQIKILFVGIPEVNDSDLQIAKSLSLEYTKVLHDSDTLQNSGKV